MEEYPDFNSESIKPISVIEAKRRLKLVVPLLDEVKDIYVKYWNSRTTFSEYNEEDLDIVVQLKYHYEKAEEDLIQIMDQFTNLDCVIKDPRIGLVDFVSIREGTPVWLCFQQGEIGLDFYHSLNGGFRGRKPIDFE